MSNVIEAKRKELRKDEQPARAGGCGRILLAVLLAGLIVWFAQPVETGVGEMSRAEAAWIFIHLALSEKPNEFDPFSNRCLKVYGNHLYEGAVRGTLLPSYGLALINTWVYGQVNLRDGDNGTPPTLSEVWDMLDDRFIEQVREMVDIVTIPSYGDGCHLPKAITWTDDFLP